MPPRYFSCDCPSVTKAKDMYTKLNTPPFNPLTFRSVFASGSVAPPSVVAPSDFARENDYVFTVVEQRKEKILHHVLAIFRCGAALRVERLALGRAGTTVG